MGHMTPHEFLINILSSTVLNVVPFLSAPIAPPGVLRENFGYEIRLPEFEETIRELLRRKGAKVPDLLLVNEKRKLLVVVECKSEFTFRTEERLSAQVEFYSSQDFEPIWKELFKGIENLEIWLCAYKGLGKNIANFIRNHDTLKNLSNVIVWEVELRRKREEAITFKVYGEHIDNELNDFMEKNGLKCSLPRTDLLIDTTLTYPERIYRIGRRILAFVATAYLTEEERKVTTEDFRSKHVDALMTNKELVRCFKYLTMLIPQIGNYDHAKQQILLAKRPPVYKIKSKLREIQSMSEENFKVELAKIGKKEPGIIRSKRPKTTQKTKLVEWMNKTAISKSSAYYYPREPEFDLTNSYECFPNISPTT